MKTTTVLCIAAIASFYFSCSSCNQIADDLPGIDVRKNYIEKEFFLTDIADVSYLHLNSDNEGYLYGGSIRVITENLVVIFDWRRESGDIFFFSKDGNPQSRFNRRGNGPGEYQNISHIYYDEEADDVFVFQYMDTRGLVFSSTGKFKREIALPQGTRMGNDLVSVDNHAFFFYDANNEYQRVMEDDHTTEIDVARYYLISKIDGVALDCIELSIPPIFLGIYLDGARIPARSKIRLISKKEGILICNPESDTVFLYGRDRSLIPILHKIPLTIDSNPITYLNNCVDMGNYQFFEVYTVRAGDIYPGVFPVKYYMRNKITGEIFQQKLLLPEYTGKELVITPLHAKMSGSENSIYFELDLLELKQAYAQNKLSGTLKELVSTLKEDDNNVYVMVQFK